MTQTFTSHFHHFLPLFAILPASPLAEGSAPALTPAPPALPTPPSQRACPAPCSTSPPPPGPPPAPHSPPPATAPADPPANRSAAHTGIQLKVTRSNTIRLSRNLLFRSRLCILVSWLVHQIVRLHASLDHTRVPSSVATGFTISSINSFLRAACSRAAGQRTASMKLIRFVFTP